MTNYVQSTEHDGEPLLGLYVATEEDAVIYKSWDGERKVAPVDCVRVLDSADARDLLYAEMRGAS